MYDSEDVRRDDLRESVGMHAKLAVPDFHCGVLDLGGEGDTGIVEQNIKPSVRRHHRVHHLGPVLFRCHVEVQVTRVMALGPQGSRRALAEVVADVAPPSRPRARTDAPPRRRSTRH
jgi:hypothetical protein